MLDEKLLHTEYGAALAKAAALRCLFHYHQARAQARARGDDLSALVESPPPAALAESYQRVLADWIDETPDNAAEAADALDFAAAIVSDRMRVELSDYGAIVSQENDLLTLAQLIAAAWGWANKQAIKEIAVRAAEKAGGC
jgi:hypothetical protein